MFSQKTKKASYVRPNDPGRGTIGRVIFTTDKESENAMNDKHNQHARVDSDTIAVIILNWNSLDHTRRCLESLFEQTYKNLYIIVIDNASTGGEGAVLKDLFPAIDVIEEKVNLGFARGVNEGLRRAFEVGAEKVLLLNNDSWFDPNEPTINLLKSALDEQPALGGVGPVVYEGDNPNIIQSAGHRFNLFTGYPHRILAGRRRGEPIPTKRPSYIVGACLLMPSAVLRRIGGMDPDYFLYGDDIDLALNMRRSGFYQALEPRASIYHLKAAATTMWSENHTYTMLRSHLILLKKHARWFHLPTLIPSIAIITVGLMVFGIKNGHPLAIKGALRAWFDFITGRWGGYRGGYLSGDRGILEPDCALPT